MCQSLEEALNALQSPPISNTVENIWIIGGASVYQVIR
jgi:dihydrofolate reductase